MNKYPRTLHFQFSPEIHSDDKTVRFEHLGNFINEEYIITEKMDGQNNCMKGSSYGVFARTHSVETQLPWDSYLIAWYHNNKHNLKENWYFLENMFAIHSIEYNKLDSYMFLFNLYNPLEKIFLSWEEVEAEAKRIGLRTPKVLFRGKFNSMSEVNKWMDKEIKKESIYGENIEGFVMRPAKAFSSDDFHKVVGKYVRKGHVQTDTHWTKNWKKAKINKFILF